MRFLNKVLAASVLAGAAVGANAVSIQNGDFSAGLTGWNTVGNVGLQNDAALLTAFGEISQNQSWAAGESLSFNWFFQAKDYVPYNDFSVFRVLDTNGAIVDDITLSNVQTVGNYGNSGWQTYNYTFAQAGVGSIQFGVYNAIDNALPSQLFVDNVRTVSESSALMMMGLGLFGLAFARKRIA